jgi:hypothetical protein
MQYEKNIPIPLQKRRIDSAYNVAKKIMDEMEVGDSVFIFFDDNAKGIANSLGQLKHRGKCNYTTRTESNGFRIWKL